MAVEDDVPTWSAIKAQYTPQTIVALMGVESGVSLKAYT